MGLTLPKINPPTFTIHEASGRGTLPPWLVPGMHASCHGSGVLGKIINKVELKLTGDPVASWAGHTIVYVGYQVLVQGRAPEPCIVEAEWPNCKLSSAFAHSDAIWANQPLTPDQQKLGTIEALSLVGMHYDAFAYVSFVNRLMKAQFLNDLDPLFKYTAKIGPICSGVDVRVEEAMHVDLSDLLTAATEDPDMICPADVLCRDIRHGWVLRSQVPV